MADLDIEALARSLYEENRHGDPSNRPPWDDLDPQITGDAEMRESAYARARDRLAPEPAPAFYEEEAALARFG